ncbi:lipopolysaccharide assembly LapA domain-containing protein [Streptomyces hygroscopicus]|uniref:LapA family protein n=1 Tax=Streptomyces hygroscopicus TaxID=1912 RepID=UPI00380E6308
MPASHQPDAPYPRNLLPIGQAQEQSADVSYFDAHGHVPLRVALLLAAVAGILLTALAGSARITQLRATARKHRRADHRAVNAEAKDSSKARR